MRYAAAQSISGVMLDRVRDEGILVETILDIIHKTIEEAGATEPSEYHVTVMAISEWEDDE